MINSEHYQKLHHKSTKQVTTPITSSLPHPNYRKDEETYHQYRHHRKRFRSRSVAKANENGSRRWSVSLLASSISSSSSCYSRRSRRSRNTAVPPIHEAAVVENVAEKYEKRSRHKTRPDKYELKVHKTALEKADVTSKRKRGKKAGLTLNNDFKAPNVPQDRLTLKPNTGPGIFHTSKASAPVERRGLPDLTFSGMKFLTKRRETDDAKQQQGAKDVQSPKKKNNRGTAQEISDFFSRPEVRELALQHPRAKASSQRKMLTKHLILATKPYPTGLDSRAFSTDSLDVAARPERWVLDHHVPTLWRYYPAKAESSIKQNKPDHMTSPNSWSVTPSSRGSLPASPNGLSGAPQSAAREPTCELRPRSPTRKDLPEIARESLDQGSISDRSLERYTKHVLLGKDKQGIWDRIPRGAGQDDHYILQDLKHLACLSKLDDVNESPTIQCDQHRDGNDWGRIPIPLTGVDTHKPVFFPHTSRGERLDAPAARSIASIPTKTTHREKGGGLRCVTSVDPAVKGPQVAPSGCQGPPALRTALPADHQPFRHLLQLEDPKLTPDRIAWLLQTNSPAPDVRRRRLLPGNAELASNPPLARMPHSVHRLGRHQVSAKPNVDVGYSELPLITQARFSELIGHLKPGKMLERLSTEHEDGQHDHPVGRGKVVDIHRKDYNSALSGGHDDFDRALLQDTRNHLDDTANILDDYEGGQLDPTIVDPATGLSSFNPHLAPAQNTPHRAASCHTRSNLVTGIRHLEEEDTAGGLGLEGIMRNQTWEQSLGTADGYGEIETGFMGFARPHNLY